jgi:hypothetical protein
MSDSRDLARGLGTAFVVAGSMLLAGCAVGPNPVIARDPIPPPPPDHRVECTNIPLIRHHHWTYCAEAAPPETAVVQVKG